MHAFKQLGVTLVTGGALFPLILFIKHNKDHITVLVNFSSDQRAVTRLLVNFRAMAGSICIMYTNDQVISFYFLSFFFSDETSLYYIIGTNIGRNFPTSA